MELVINIIHWKQITWYLPKKVTAICQVNLQSINGFTYLGSEVNNRHDNSAKIKQRTYLANKAYHGLKRHWQSHISKLTTCLWNKVLIGPILIYDSEIWIILKQDHNVLGQVERKILWYIYKGIFIDGIWHGRYNFELSDQKKLYAKTIRQKSSGQTKNKI